MSNTDNTLPEELKKQLFEKADAYANQMPENAVYGIRIGYIAGATEYAQYKVKFEQTMAILKFNHSVLYNQIKSFLDGSK